MTLFFRAASAGFALALVGSMALAETDIMQADTAVGKILTNAEGMSLYVFDKDTANTSTCYDQCAANWPPLLAPAGTAAEDDFGLTTRTDGNLQWTYYGKPLYLWKDDTNPGDITGDGVGGVWRVAKVE